MSLEHNPRWSLVVRRVGWALSLALVLLLLQSAFWSERVPVVLKVAVAGLAILAAVRPGHALLLVAGFVPFGHFLITRVWDAYPFALSEALVLAFLTGYLWHRRPQRSEISAPPDGLNLPAKLFALVVLGSSLVQLAELQVWHDFPLRYAESFADFLVTDYLATMLDPRPWVDGRTFVSTAALLLEGLALSLCARTLCRQQPALARRLTNAIVTAGTAVALLGFYSVLALAVRTGEPILGLIDSNRWASPALLSLNTAGAYFVLVAFIAMGTAVASRTHVPGLLAAVICVIALWLTRTRSAIVAGLAITAAGTVWLAASRLRSASVLRTTIVAGLVAFGLTLYVVVSNPLHVLASGGSVSLHHRVLSAETALRMIATSPLVGIGTGRYAMRYPEFASAELLALYAHNDAHNYFLWIGAELGLLGLGLFLWFLFAAVARGWSQLRARRSDYWFLGTFAGLLAFMVTWTIGQPLSIPHVAYTFWIVLGLTVAHPTGDMHGVSGGHLRLLRRVAAVATVTLIVGSVPIRAYRARSEIDLSRVRYGFYNAGTANGRDFQWAGPRVRLFKRSSVKAINIPLAAKLPDTPHGADVDILVNGLVARHIELRDKEWHDIRVTAPASAEPFWQVDLHITPIDVPADLEDARRRVCIAEISVDPQPEGR